MTGRPMTDAQLAAGLRAHLAVPGQAALRERILSQVQETPQRRRLPSFLAALTDADPRTRRRAILLAAVLGLALSLSIAAIVGSLLQQRTLDLSLDPPGDVNAFVVASYARYVDLPALRLRLEWPEPSIEGEPTIDPAFYEPTVDIFYYDGQGAVRNDHPGSSSPNASIWTSELTAFFHPEVDAWVLYPPGEDDPRARIADLLLAGGTNCVSGWRHHEAVQLIGRWTHHVSCTNEDPAVGRLERHLWIDIETGLALKVSTPSFSVDEAGSQVPLPPVIALVTELDFGPQPASLFIPDGPTMTACEYDPIHCVSPPPGSPAPDATPLVTPPPALDQDGVPESLDAYVAAVFRDYASLPAVEIVAVVSTQEEGIVVRSIVDGLGNVRNEYTYPPEIPVDPWVALTTGGHFYESLPQPDGTVQWRDHGPVTEPPRPETLGLPPECGGGWVHLGVDVVLDRRADHVACGFQEFWIDREWRIVTRAHDHDPLAGDPNAGVSQVLSVTFGPQPAALFEPPPPEALITPPPG